MKSILRTFFGVVLLFASVSAANADGYYYGGPQGYYQPAPQQRMCLVPERDAYGRPIPHRAMYVPCGGRQVQYRQQRPPQQYYQQQRPQYYQQRRSSECWECAVGAILGAVVGSEIRRSNR